MTKIDKSEDPRFQRSLEALIDAITRLIEKGGLQGLSIKQVTEEAGVSRPTFYQHAQDVNDLARRAALMRLGQALPCEPALKEPAGLSPLQIKEQVAGHVRPLLEHLAQNRGFYVAVLEHASSPALFSAIVDLLASRMAMKPFEALGGAGEVSFEGAARVLSGGLMWHVVGRLREAGDPLDADPLRPAALDPEALAQEVAALAVFFLCHEGLGTKG